jgi:hypothetical protein
MKTPWFIPVATLAIGAVGGYLTGQNAEAPADTAVTESANPRQRASARAGQDGGAAESRRNARSRTLEEIQRIPGQASRLQALMDYYAGLSPDQLEAEARKLEGLPMSERMVASFLLFGRWAESDPMAAMAYSNSMGMAGGFVRPTILQSWASVDPENAARYYAENSAQFMGGMMGGGSGAASIAGEWARQDPNGALAWANTLQGREKSDAISSVVREVASTDPARAAELAATLDPAARGDAYRTIASQWGASNFAEAETWIRSLPADQQDAAMAEALAGLSRENPQLAAQKLASMPPGSARDEAAATLAGNWGRQAPAEALAWIMKEGSEEAQRQAVRDIIPNLAARDDAAALAFVSGQPAGQVRDSAASAYVMNNRSSNISTVMRVAESIEDDGSRMRTVGMAAGRWMREDPAAATTYIQQSESIPEGIKERLIEGGGMGWGGQGRGRGR